MPMLSAQGDAVQRTAVHWRRYGVHEVATVHEKTRQKYTNKEKRCNLEALRLILGLHHNSFLSLHSLFLSSDFVDASDVILEIHI